MNGLTELLRIAAPPLAPGRAPTSTRTPLSAARYASINVALRAMLVGIVDPRQDGEISDNEQEVLQVALTSAWDYLASLGAVREDLDALLNDWDARTADCIRDLVTAVTPDDDRASIAAVNSFVFGPATRAHSKAVVRVTGPVRLSARQRLAIHQAQERSHSRLKL